MAENELMMLGIALVEGAIGGLTYAFWGYAKNRESTPTNKETFKPYKLIATVLFGAGLGFANVILGQPITFDSIYGAIMANGGAVAILQNVLKWMARWYRNRYGPLPWEGKPSAVG